MNSSAALSTPTLTEPGVRIYGGAAAPPDSLTDEICDRCHPFPAQTEVDVMTEYFAIITISQPINGGAGALHGTFTCTMRVGADTTRHAIYEHVLKKLPRQFHGGSVMFFSAEPNRTPH